MIGKAKTSPLIDPDYTDQNQQLGDNQPLTLSVLISPCPLLLCVSKVLGRRFAAIFSNFGTPGNFLISVISVDQW